MRTLARLLLGGESRVTFILLTVAVACLPLGIMAQEWLDDDFVLVSMALSAAVVGFVLGRWRVNRVLALLVGSVGGLALTLILAGDLFPPMWLWNRGPELLTFWQEHALLLWARATGWSNTVFSGGESYDNVVLLLILLIVVWGASFWAGWDLPRRRSPLAALLPTGLVLLVIVGGSEHGDGRWTVIVFLTCALLLLTRANLTVLERRWDRQDKDYSAELYYDIFFYGFAIVVVLVLVVALVPLPVQNPLSRAIWSHLYEPVKSTQTVIGRLFAGAQHAAAESSFLEHEISGTVVVGDDVVFTVATDEPHPLPPNLAAMLEDESGVPNHYWRDAVYDRYTGRGWETSLSLTHLVHPGEPLTIPPASGKRLVQTVTRQAPAAGLLYAANQPVATDRFVRVRGDPPGSPSGDVLAVRVPAGHTYVVTSTLVTATVAQLRAAPPTYPTWVQERYAAPPATTGRVRALARDLTAEATTSYDKAAVIEAYLRRLTYDTEVPAPSLDHDIVDWFLFDLQEGYCDHFATAMVVLSRAAGVPARLATGFAAGEYDHHNYRYVVLQKYAHAWVEVYFPGYGWVEFEPTPALVTFDRPSGEEQTGPTAKQLLDRWEPKEYREEPSPAVWLLLGGLAAVVILATGVLAYYLRRPAVSPEEMTAAGAYTQLAQRAGRFGAGPQAWQTPREYLAALGRRLAWGLARLPAVLRRNAPDPEQTLSELGSRYEEDQYSPHELDAREQTRAWGIWERWRNWVWVVVLGR